ncbi:hypothetical protein DSO57_1021759 [Entomophthora muscae]|nr:hypothetical protein DSO57_1021759 [Entomophthora muscae]
MLRTSYPLRPFGAPLSRLCFIPGLKYRHRCKKCRHSCLFDQASQLSTTASNSQHTNSIFRKISVAPMVDVSSPHFLYLLRLIGGPKPQLYTEMYHAKAILSFQQDGKLDFRLGLNNSSPRQIHAGLFAEPPDGSLIHSIRHTIPKNPAEIFGNIEARDNTVVQVGGSDPDSLARATEVLAKQREFSAINLNLGCPSAAVQAGDFGAALMKDVDRVIDCIQAMEASADGRIPVTVKCRLGVDEFDSEEFILNFVDRLSSKTSVTHFIMHARKCLLKGLSPAKNRSIPPLNYGRVHTLAKAFPHLSFTLNGGIRSLEEVQKQFNSNLNGIMLGRKMMDNPSFLIPLIKEFLDPDFTPTPQESIYACYLEYLLSQLERGHRPTILIKPTMYLFPGKQGRDYRTGLMTVPFLKSYHPKKPYSPIVDGNRIRKELVNLGQSLHQPTD